MIFGPKNIQEEFWAQDNFGKACKVFSFLSEALQLEIIQNFYSIHKFTNTNVYTLTRMFLLFGVCWYKYSLKIKKKQD